MFTYVTISIEISFDILTLFTSGVKVRPVLKKVQDNYFIKQRTWKANIAKIIIFSETLSTKLSIVDIRQGSKHVWIYLNNSWICLIMPEYARRFQDMPNMRDMVKSAKMALFHIFSSMQSLVYLNVWLLISRLTRN